MQKGFLYMSGSLKTFALKFTKSASWSAFLFYLPFSFFVLLVLFNCGCAQPEKAIKEYTNAVMFYELDQNEMAVQKLESAIRADKKFPLAYSLLGEIYSEQKTYEKSAEAYEKAVELNPWSFRDNFNLGHVYEKMNEFAKAVEAYVQACETKPEHVQCHANAARCYYLIKDYKNALLYGQRAVQLDPDVQQIQEMLRDIRGPGKLHKSYRGLRTSFSDRRERPECTNFSFKGLSTNREK